MSNLCPCSVGNGVSAALFQLRRAKDLKETSPEQTGLATVVSRSMDIDARLKAGANILNVSAADKTPALVREIRSDFPNVPIIATGGPTDESVAETVEAGANAISYTPPSTKVLFQSIMNGYRQA